MAAWVMRHRLSWDLTGIPEKSHRGTVQRALNACSYPFSRIRKRTGKRVPVTTSDLSRFSEALAEASKTGHAHVHGPSGETGHLLGVPTGARAAALGLYWLPTREHPAGRVELDTGVFRNFALAQEVFLAEAAHAVDYGAMTESQRAQVLALFEHVGAGHAHEGWFEEKGEDDYWSWRGERFMGLFMATYAPSLSRPLERQQPWHWSYDAADVAAVKKILR
jgi:hypothetical protein